MLYNIKSKFGKGYSHKKGYKVTKLNLDNQRCNLCNLCNLHFAEIGEKQNVFFLPNQYIFRLQRLQLYILLSNILYINILFVTFL